MDDYTWQCQACKYIGITDSHRNQHIMFHLYADTMLIELLDEVPPNYYPLQFHKV